MTALSQRDLAIAIGVSEMTVSRHLKALYRPMGTFTEFDALRVLTVEELRAAGFSTGAAIELLNEASAEILYLHVHPENRCWIAFVETEEASFRLAVLSTTHLMAVVEAFPLATVMPLHRMVSAARTGLERITARKRPRIAA